ncbi:hypothetical protein VNO80_09546 [Phaseolus coccineus]|uniref:Uncharacterized protein n=1 Tax=Phaseolus coccineus TaxID=3886 RepID=A0AAN9RII4_PHACN
MSFVKGKTEKLQNFNILMFVLFVSSNIALLAMTTLCFSLIVLLATYPLSSLIFHPIFQTQSGSRMEWKVTTVDFFYAEAAINSIHC